MSEASEGLIEQEKQADTPVQEIPLPIREGAYLIVKQADGNFKGYTTKYGKQVEVRDIGPETVLQLLLTHDGK